MPRASAAVRAADSLREAIARRSHSALFFIPGSTRCRPIFAVLRIPQTTFLMLHSPSGRRALGRRTDAECYRSESMHFVERASRGIALKGEQPQLHWRGFTRLAQQSGADALPLEL